MYTARAQTISEEIRKRPTGAVSPVMSSTTIYVRHRSKCPHRNDADARHYRRCGCPLWFQKNRKRWSAETNDWSEALKKASDLEADGKSKTPSTITVESAIDLYLIKRSKKVKDALQAPYKDRYMLLIGSKAQPSLLAWANENHFVKLRSITAAALDAWRDTWVFRANSYAMKIYNAIVKAFFTWAAKFDYLDKNPYDKLDAISVHEVPTLPLEPEEFPRLLAAVTVLQPRLHTFMTTLILLMRWSGLSIGDAGCLRRDALDNDNRLRTHRKKTGEFVYCKLPAFVADMLRAQGNVHPDYFFWDKSKRLRTSQVAWIESWLVRIYDAAGIKPRGAQRLRDTFATEFLNSGGTIEDLAMLLGHSTTATTWKHYAPWVRSRQIRLDTAVDKFHAAQGINEHEPAVQPAVHIQ
jgi:integrase